MWLCYVWIWFRQRWTPNVLTAWWWRQIDDVSNQYALPDALAIAAVLLGEKKERVYPTAHSNKVCSHHPILLARRDYILLLYDYTAHHWRLCLQNIQELPQKKTETSYKEPKVYLCARIYKNWYLTELNREPSLQLHQQMLVQAYQGGNVRCFCVRRQSRATNQLDLFQVDILLLTFTFQTAQATAARSN